jgi:uncharacterized protein YecE (DUF72 family)
MLVRHKIGRVAADPAPVKGADVPGGWTGIVYYRLHGSPRKYWSKYDEKYIDALARRIQAAMPVGGVWCVFDNTASGAALENSWELNSLLSENDNARNQRRTS